MYFLTTQIACWLQVISKTYFFSKNYSFGSVCTNGEFIYRHFIVSVLLKQLKYGTYSNMSIATSLCKWTVSNQTNWSSGLLHVNILAERVQGLCFQPCRILAWSLKGGACVFVDKNENASWLKVMMWQMQCQLSLWRSAVHSLSLTLFNIYYTYYFRPIWPAKEQMQ